MDLCPVVGSGTFNSAAILLPSSASAVLRLLPLDCMDCRREAKSELQWKGQGEGDNCGTTSTPLSRDNLSMGVSWVRITPALGCAASVATTC